MRRKDAIRRVSRSTFEHFFRLTPTALRKVAHVKWRRRYQVFRIIQDFPKDSGVLRELYECVAECFAGPGKGAWQAKSTKITGAAR